MAKSRDLSALRSIYLEKVYLERLALPTLQPSKRTPGGSGMQGTGPRNSLFLGTIPIKGTSQSAEIFFTCDDRWSSLNGQSIGSTDLWSKPRNHGDRKHFRKGVNFLTAKASNGGGLAGLIAQLSLKSKNGKVSIFVRSKLKFVSQLPNPQAKDWHTRHCPMHNLWSSLGSMETDHGATSDFLRVSLQEANQLLNCVIECPVQITLWSCSNAKDNPRPTLLRHRGEYTKPKGVVPSGIPDIFGLPAGQEPPPIVLSSRWVVSDKNPIGDRVVVNRAWRSFFGYGLIRTSGDFGTQAPAPDHPELLDWLAVEFRKRGMSLKKLHRLIVSSSTYRQDSKVSPSLFEKDPQNRLLARAPLALIRRTDP